MLLVLLCRGLLPGTRARLPASLLPVASRARVATVLSTTTTLADSLYVKQRTSSLLFT